MSGEEMELHDPDVPWQRKLGIRLKRIARFWVGSVVGMIAVFIAFIAIAVIYFATPELVRMLQTP